MDRPSFVFLTRERVGGVIVILIATALLMVLIQNIRRRYKKQLLERGTMVTGAYIAFGITRPILLLIALFLILSTLGVNISSMLTGLGIAGAIIGLALQDVLKDAIMGIHLVAGHFFSVGDVVEYNGIEGTVVGFTLSTTKIGNNSDHSIYSISNREITRVHRLADRLDLDVPTPYDTPSGEVLRCLETICEQIRQLEGVEKCEIVGLEAFMDSAVVYRIRVFCPAQLRGEIRRAAQQFMLDELDAAGIGLAVAQMDVRLKK